MHTRYKLPSKHSQYHHPLANTQTSSTANTHMQRPLTISFDNMCAHRIHKPTTNICLAKTHTQRNTAVRRAERTARSETKRNLTEVNERRTLLANSERKQIQNTCDFRGERTCFTLFFLLLYCTLRLHLLLLPKVRLVRVVDSRCCCCCCFGNCHIQAHGKKE